MRAGFILVEAVCQIPRKGPGAHNVVEKPDPGVGVGRCRYSPTCSDLEGFVKDVFEFNPYSVEIT